MLLQYKKNSRRERRNRRLYEESGGDLNSHFRHSTYYHHYFADYSEERIPRKNGRGYSVQRKYVGKLYRADLSDRKWISLKIVNLLLFAASFALFLYGGCLPVDGTTSIPGAILGMLSVLSLILLFASCIDYLVQKRELKAFHYHATLRNLRYASLGSAVAQWALALETLIYALVTAAGHRPAASVYLACTCYLLSGGAAFLIFLLEKHTRYVAVSNSETPYEDGVVIH